jgi:hypothetical protein
MPTLSEASNDHALCCMLNHGSVLVELLHCQLESTLPPAAQLLLSQSQQGDLVGYHLRLSNILEILYRPSCEPLYVANASHRIQEIFMNILCSESFCPQEKRTTERCPSVVYSSSPVSILTTVISLWSCTCTSAAEILMKLDCAAT